ncbi:MAG: hypothetical protein R3293_16015, partial [Candidatus Promineifilaceae bacterium]|nr:hypothetical protein [Candidatus Promineifilaceae bacterium]
MMGQLAKYKGDLLIMVGFLILPFLLFGAVSLGGKTMLPVDNLFQWAPWSAAAEQFDAVIPHNNLLTDLIIENYAWKLFAVNSLRTGEIPLWNPNLFAGAPFLATGQHSMLYPFSWLFFLLKPANAYGWYTVMQLWLAAVSMYIFGRILGMRRGSSALAGLIYQGSGFLVVSAAVFPMIVGAAVWLPLLLACIEKIIGTSERRTETTLLWVALGAVSLGLQILAGHIEITYYTLLIMAVFASWRLGKLAVTVHRHSNASWIKHVVRPASWLIAMVGIGIMLGAVQLIPFYEVGQANFREGSATFTEVRGWAFPLRRVVTLVLPNFFGNPAHHSYIDAFNWQNVAFNLNSFGELNPQGAYSSDWGIKNYVEGGIYLGILPLLLSVLGVVATWRAKKGSLRRSHGLFFILLALFSLAFIFGTPLYALLYYGLPFINQLHTPFRWVWPLSFAVAVLAGFGVDMLLAQRNRGQTEAQRVDMGLIKLLLGAGILAGTGVLSILLISWIFFSRLEPAIWRLFHGLALAPTAFADTRAFFSYEFWQLLILGLLLLASAVVLWLGLRDKSRLFLLLAAFLIIGDVYLANREFNAAEDPTLLAYKPQLIAWLEEQPGLWRLTTFTPHGDKPLNANTPWLYDFQDIRGYDSIIPKQFTSYMSAIEAQNELPFNRIQPVGRWESLNSPLLDTLGVRYIISSESIDLPKLEEVWRGEGVYVYENLAVAPRAYILPWRATVVAEDALVALAEYDPR